MNEQEQYVSNLKGKYPILPEAVQWYGGKHCPTCRTLVKVQPFGFQNGWDSALQVVLNFLKK